MCRTVQCVTLAGEECAEGALCFGSVGINLATATFTHSLSRTSAPILLLGPSLTRFLLFIILLLFIHLSHVLLAAVTEGLGWCESQRGL